MKHLTQKQMINREFLLREHPYFFKDIKKAR